MIHNKIMIRINIHEAKTHLSKYLKRLRGGNFVLICKRNVPVAELRSVPARRTTPRPLGAAKGEFEVSPSFYLPLPDDVLNAFDGKSGG